MGAALPTKTTSVPAPPRALPGLWREIGGLDRLVRLDVPAATAGMVVVARRGEDWQRRPELRWQAWPDDLEPDLRNPPDESGTRAAAALRQKRPGEV